MSTLDDLQSELSSSTDASSVKRLLRDAKKSLSAFASPHRQIPASYSTFLHFLIENLLVDWLACFTVEERTDLFDSCFLSPTAPALETLLVLSSALTNISATLNTQPNDQDAIYALRHVIRLCSEFVSTNRVGDVLLLGSHHWPSKSSGGGNRAVELLCALPIRVANSTRGGPVPHNLGRGYVSMLLEQMVRVWRTQVGKKLNEFVVTVGAELLVRLCIHGHSKRVVQAVCSLVINDVHDDVHDDKHDEEDDDKHDVHDVHDDKHDDVDLGGIQSIVPSIIVHGSAFETFTFALLHHLACITSQRIPSTSPTPHETSISLDQCKKAFTSLYGKHIVRKDSIGSQVRHVLLHNMVVIKVLPCATLRLALLLLGHLDDTMSLSDDAMSSSDDAMSSSDGDGTHPSRYYLRLQCVIHAASVWKDASFLRRTSKRQQRHVTRVLLVILPQLPQNVFRGALLPDASTPLLQALVDGVHVHLGSALPGLRKQGMLVGEVFSRIISPEHPLVFEHSEDSDDEVHWRTDRRDDATPSPVSPTMCSIDHEDDTPGDVDESNAHSIHEDEQHSLGDAMYSSGLVHQDGMVADEHDESDGEDPDALFFNDEDSMDSDDLEPFDLDDDHVDGPITPVFLRECLSGLRATKEPDQVEGALQALQAVLHAQPPDVEDLCVPLARTLLHLQDEYALPGFQANRMGGLALVAAQWPRKVVPYLTGQFYENEHVLQRRVDILRVLVDAAGQLATPTSQVKRNEAELSHHSSPAHVIHAERLQAPRGGLGMDGAPGGVDDPPLAPWELREARIRANTRTISSRRWGAGKPAKGHVNPFVSVVGLFFYPLAARYDTNEGTLRLLSEDSFILSHLIHALAVFIALAGPYFLGIENMARALLDLISAVRYHDDAVVRRASLYGVSRVFGALPRQSLVDLFLSEFTELHHWAKTLATSDPDPSTRAYAYHDVALFASLAEEIAMLHHM